MFYLQDLSRSSLDASDMSVREIGLPERSALDLNGQTNGYVIPYYDIDGYPTPYYRARIDTLSKHKYRQPKNSNNAVYFPKEFRQTLNGHKYVIFTEGEKKAASADKHGFPCVAFGGVYSWKSNTIKLPADSIISSRPGTDTAIIPKTHISIRLTEEVDIDRMMDKYAAGFDQLIDLIRAKNLRVIIVFDSSSKGSPFNNITLDVQRAAAKLGMELRTLGIKMGNIRQLALPLLDQDKMGLDDYIKLKGAHALHGLIDEVMQNRKGFPHHPDLREHITRKLQYPKLTRRDVTQLGLSIVAQLDFNGRRLRAIPNGDMYYFDGRTKELYPMTTIGAAHGSAPVIHDKFASMLYREFDITIGDNRLTRVLNTQISCEDYIDDVIPRKGVFVEGDTIHFQISSKEYASVNKDGIQIHDNGTNNIMFETQEHADELDGNDLLKELQRQIDQPLQPWWHDTLRQTRLEDDDKLHASKLAALLFYVSPWLHRWRGTQLPIEIATGEAGSGKSTLYALRLAMLTGRQDLCNRPKNMADWYSTVTAVGGLHVTDNANFEADPSLGQFMSDEMCRLITEPTPTVQMRRYYTERGLLRVPVNATFAITSLRLPFRQLDLIQRSVHLSLARGISADAYAFDANWLNNQLSERGGRIGWVAHHLIVLHKFFKAVDGNWNEKYKARFRLIHLEQSLKTMAGLFGWKSDWIPEYLAQSVQASSAEVDWILQGLQAYAKENQVGFVFRVQSVANWAMMHDEFETCKPLCDARRLGKYLTEHVAMVAQVAKIGPLAIDSTGNMTYQILP